MRIKKLKVECEIDVGWNTSPFIFTGPNGSH